jgi:hypothetical protein
VSLVNQRYNCSRKPSSYIRLARSTGSAGNVRALGAVDTAGDLDLGPVPLGARALAAKNVGLDTLGSHGTGDTRDIDVGDGNTSGGLAGGRAVLVVLLDDNAVLADVLHRDTRVGDVVDGTGGTRDGLDADTVVRLNDLGVLDKDTVDDVAGTAADRADADTVTARAEVLDELDVGARVDGEAVVLVLDVGVGDGDAVRVANVESIGVVSTLSVTITVVHGDVVNSQSAARVDAEGLDRGVLDVQAIERGLLQVVGREELGLGDATVSTNTIPPPLAIAVDDVTTGAVDSDLVTSDTDQRALPLLVTKSGLALEGDGGTVLKLGQVEGSSRRHVDVVEVDVGARGLALHGSCGICEGAAVTSIQARGDGRH